MRFPRKVKINSGTTYKILYQEFDDFGECNVVDKEITVKISLSEYWKMRVLIHEVYHAIDFAEAIGLTEAQTVALERGTARFLLINKLVNPKKKRKRVAPKM